MVEKLLILPHFFGFHAISRVFAQFCEVYLKLGHIYSQKNGGRVGRAMFSTPAGLSNMGSQGVKNLHFFMLHPYNPNFLGSDGPDSMGS